MENFLAMLLGENAFGGPGGPGGLGEAPAPGAGGGMFDKLGAMGKAIQPPQGQKPVFSGGVQGANLPFTQRMEDMITPALNAQASRRASVPQLPTFAQLLAG